MCSMPRRSDIFSVIVVLEVAAPLLLAIDGGVAVFSRAVMLELGPEVGCGETCRCRCAHYR
jgi:hypothetical protein